MKKLLVATAVLLLSVVPAMAGNYAKGTLGYFTPSESELDGGFNLYGAYGLDLQDTVNAPVTAEFGIGYTAPSATGVDITIIPITATALYALPVDVPNVVVNVGAGLGMYMWSVEVDMGPFGTFEDDGNDFGFHLQAGADYKLDEQLALVGELKWSSVDIGDGGEGGGISVNVGAKYGF